MLKPHHFYAALLILAACQSGSKADHIYFNAKVWTGDPAHPNATAVAVKDSAILYVGDDYKSYQGSSTVMEDLQGKMLVPGFIDNHTHFLNGGALLGFLNLRAVTSADAFVGSVKKYTDSLGSGNSWIMGGNWDHEAWGGKLPAASWIDSVSGNHPLFLDRYDGHMALVNSVAMKMAGVDKATKDPPGGRIERDPKTGMPTGIFRDGAIELVRKVIPPPTEKELDLYLSRAVQHALSHGFTQVNDMSYYGGWPDLATYQRAEAAGKLPIRIYSFVPLRTWQKLDSFVKKNGLGDSRLHWGGLKGFVDGSLGSTTAWFYKPYLDAPNSTGLQVTDTALLRKWITAADSAGLHVTTHAIGDRANDWLQSVFASAEKINGPKDRRFRIEHAQHLTDSAITNFAKLDIIPSVQPYHQVDDGKWAYKRLDTPRLRGTYAFHRLLEAGARATFGSDWPVAPLDPMAGIYAAVTRRTNDGKNPDGWFPAEKITVDQALRCYTVNNAYASFQENKIGTIKAGMLADLTILSQDLFSVAPEKIAGVPVYKTIVNGKEVYQNKP